MLYTVTQYTIYLYLGPIESGSTNVTVEVLECQTSPAKLWGTHRILGSQDAEKQELRAACLRKLLEDSTLRWLHNSHHTLLNVVHITSHSLIYLFVCF